MIYGGWNNMKGISDEAFPLSNPKLADKAFIEMRLAEIKIELNEPSITDQRWNTLCEEQRTLRVKLSQY